VLALRVEVEGLHLERVSPVRPTATAPRKLECGLNEDMTSVTLDLLARLQLGSSVLLKARIVCVVIGSQRKWV
jgi:hypothetical protein